MKEGNQVQGILKEFAPEEEALKEKRRTEIQDGLSFLDGEIRPILQEFNELKLHGRGQIFVSFDEVQHSPKISLEWKPSEKIRGKGVAALVKSVVIYHTMKPVNHVAFEGERPFEPALIIRPENGTFPLSFGRLMFVDGPVKRKEDDSGKFEEGENYEKSQIFGSSRYRRIQREDWLPKLVEGILDIYESGGTKTFSSKYYPESKNINELKQTIELLVDGKIQELKDKPDSVRKEGEISALEIQNYLSELLSEINTKVFNKQCELSAWEKEEETHEHWASHTGIGSLGEATSHFISKHEIKADVLRFTLPDGRIIRFFINHNEKGALLYSDRHDSGKEEGWLCLDLHQNKNYYLDNSHREVHTTPSSFSFGLLEGIVCKTIAQEYSPLWNK